jgi:Amyloid A4 N-terminal heparin-binding
LPQYLSEDGRWTSELSVKVPGVSCLRDKMDLLDYCKKVSQFITVIFFFFGVRELGNFISQYKAMSAAAAASAAKKR